MEHSFQTLGRHTLIMSAETEGDRPVLAAVAGERRTLLMDAGNSPAHAAVMARELARRGIRRPDMIILTHWHWDHTFGLPYWDTASVAHAGTAEALGELAGLEWSEAALAGLVRQGVLNEESAADIRLEYGDPAAVRTTVPDAEFQGGMTFDLGGVRCRIEHVGGDHAADSCYMYVEEDRVLFLGDALAPSVYGGPRRYTGTEFLRLLALAYGYGADWYVESHGRPMTEAEFRADLHAWERLARLADVFGTDRERIASELKLYLKADSLPADLEQAVGWFTAGDYGGR